MVIFSECNKSWPFFYMLKELKKTLKTNFDKYQGVRGQWAILAQKSGR